MASIEEVIRDLARLTPEQVDEVARMVHGLARIDYREAPRPPALPTHIVDEAVRHGWQAQLFTELFGCLPAVERPAQPSAQDRVEL